MSKNLTYISLLLTTDIALCHLLGASCFVDHQFQTRDHQHVEYKSFIDPTIKYIIHGHRELY